MVKATGYGIRPFAVTPGFRDELGDVMADTHSVQFPYIRNRTGYTSISRNAYLFLLPLVGLNPKTTGIQSEWI